MTHALGIVHMIFLNIVTKEEMQPDEEVTKKILYWVEKLGLDQVRRIIMSTIFFFFFFTDDCACNLFLRHVAVNVG